MTARPANPPRTGIVTGLAAEADCLRKSRAGVEPRILVSGGVPARTGELARSLVEEGAVGLVSFGVAGGLDPALGAGTILLPREIVTADGARFAADTAWREALAAALGGNGAIHRGTRSNTTTASRIDLASAGSRQSPAGSAPTRVRGRPANSH